MFGLLGVIQITHILLILSTFNAGVNSLTYIVFGNAINTSVCTDTAFLHLTINPLEYGSAAVVACDSYLWEGIYMILQAFI